jgi:hypothetical protein
MTSRVYWAMISAQYYPMQSHILLNNSVEEKKLKKSLFDWQSDDDSDAEVKDRWKETKKLLEG